MDYSLYIEQLKYLIPEATVLVFALVAMIVHVFIKLNGRRIAGFISIAGLIAAAFSSYIFTIG